MNKTVYTITKMDCSAEEQMIRMKLANLEQVRSLDFDLPARILTVYHDGDPMAITTAIDSLNLNRNNAETEELPSGFLASDENHVQQRRLLWQVLAINFLFFVVEIVTGFISNSMGLVADSLDMLADSIVYGMALFVVGGTMAGKARVATLSGYFEFGVAIIGAIEVIRRFFGGGEVPEFKTMIIVSALALIANAICLYLLQRSKSKEAHMRASMIFTSNDIVVNLGVIVAGILVYLTESKVPDLVVGICVFILVARGAFRILKLGK